MAAPIDVEGVFVAGLKSRMPGVKVSTRVPADRVGVKVTRAGGSRLNLAQERPTVLFECWAATELAALQLALDVWRHVDDLLSTDARLAHAGDGAMSSPVNFPDGVSTNPRYQFTAQLIANLEVSP